MYWKDSKVIGQLIERCKIVAHHIFDCCKAESVLSRRHASLHLGALHPAWGSFALYLHSDLFPHWARHMSSHILHRAHRAPSWRSCSHVSFYGHDRTFKGLNLLSTKRSYSTSQLHELIDKEEVTACKHRNMTEFENTESDLPKL